MKGLIPFNRNSNVARMGNDTGFETFYNMLDDFFSDNWLPNRNLLKDTFKIDIKETEKEYFIEAELPGIKKEEINLSIDEDNLCISVNRTEETANADEGKNYIHRERRATSMSRRIRLLDAKLDGIKAKLEEGVLTITVPKNEKIEKQRKINIE